MILELLAKNSANSLGNQPWLLKNPLSKIPLRIDHVTMPHKPFVGVARTFSIHEITLIFRDFESFNIHSTTQSSNGIGSVCRLPL